MAAFHQVILPIASQFAPQLTIVSAGFDAARGDPMGGCEISPEGYGLMTQMLRPLSAGRIALLLEGGYSISSLTESFLTCVRALLGETFAIPKLTTIKPYAVDAIKLTIESLSPYWSFSFDVDLPVGPKSLESTLDHLKQLKSKSPVYRKGEFLAVRNSEDGFCLLQCKEDVFEKTLEFSICWLVQIEKKKKRNHSSQVNFSIEK